MRTRDVQRQVGGLALSAPRGARRGETEKRRSETERRDAAGWSLDLRRISTRLPQLLVALSTASIVGVGVNLLLYNETSHPNPLFLLVAACLGVVVFAFVSRQRRVVDQLSAREAQLGAQRALLQSTLENMGEGLSVFDRDGRLIAWNAQFAKLVDLPLDLSNASLYEILLGQARRGDFGPVDDPEREARERAIRFYAELPTVKERRAGNGRVLQIRRRAMPDGGVVSLYSDVTERKAFEHEMEQARAEAELANRAKGDFLANMSHELRTPLNAIIGFSEAIAGEILGPVADKRQLEYIKDIHSSGLLLLSIINDVLDMSKIEAGKLELAHERVAIQRVVAEAVRMVSDGARSRDIKLVSTVPSQEIAILGDERAVKQVMLNLLSNAVKFSHDGGRVDIRASLDADRNMRIEVEDRGIGMAPEEIHRALQPFGQAKSATTRTHGGTGLGLPIAKGLTKALGGELAIDSAPGRGTRVRITLPPPGEMPGAIQTLLRDFGDPVSGVGAAAD